MAKFSKIVEFDTIYSADSVEWCPIVNFRHIFVCGTYQLEVGSDGNKNNKRIGKLYLFQLKNNSEILKLLQEIHIPAILDCKWAHVIVENKILLAVANSVGEVIIFQLKDDETLHLDQLCKYEMVSNTILSLSLDWSTGLYDSSDVHLAVSDSEGFISILQFRNSDLFEKLRVKSHDFEAWIVAYNYWNTNILCTGGDDAKMNIYDISISTDKPIYSNKTHSSGVTSMHCNLKKEHIFVTGSYDEEIRYWDTRNMRHPTDNINVGGGVWRLKWEPEDSNKLLAACMYNGFTAVDSTTNMILADYKQHDSIAYGIDWCHLDEAQILNMFKNVDSKKIKN